MDMTNKILPNNPEDGSEPIKEGKTYAPEDKSYEAVKWRVEQATARRKAEAEALAASLPPVPAVQMLLDLWPEAVRAFPNVALRSALFSINKIRKMAKKRVRIASVDGIEMRFKGEQFIQTDLDVCEALFHLGRLHPLGDRVCFTAHSLLKLLGRETGKTQHEQLKEDIARLAAGMIEITWVAEDKAFGGALISSFFRDNATGEYVVILNKNIKMLFDAGNSYIEFIQRQSLGQHNLAKWLHGFYSSHANPYPYQVKTLQNLCGSEATLREYRRLLKDALKRLVGTGSIAAWNVDESDLVHIQKQPTPTQMRHLKKKNRP
jgi:TrfA protein